MLNSMTVVKTSSVLILISVLIPSISFGAVEISDGSVIGLWHFNGDSADSSGNGFNGNDTAVSYNPGLLNDAYFGDGSTTHTYLDTTSSLALACPFSVAFWLKQPSGGIGSGFTTPVNQWNYSESKRQWTFDNGSAANSFYFNISDNGLDAGNTKVGNTSLGSLADSWMHVVGEYDCTNMKFYLNGTLSSSTPKGSMYSVAGPYTQFSGQGGSSLVSGSLQSGMGIDELVIFNTAISTTTISELYNDGIGNEVCVTAGCASTSTPTSTSGLLPGFTSHCEVTGSSTDCIRGLDLYLSWSIEFFWFLVSMLGVFWLFKPYSKKV